MTFLGAQVDSYLSSRDNEEGVSFFPFSNNEVSFLEVVLRNQEVTDC